MKHHSRSEREKIRRREAALAAANSNLASGQPTESTPTSAEVAFAGSSYNPAIPRGRWNKPNPNQQSQNTSHNQDRPGQGRPPAQTIALTTKVASSTTLPLPVTGTTTTTPTPTSATTALHNYLKTTTTVGDTTSPQKSSTKSAKSSLSNRSGNDIDDVIEGGPYDSDDEDNDVDALTIKEAEQRRASRLANAQSSSRSDHASGKDKTKGKETKKTTLKPGSKAISVSKYKGQSGHATDDSPDDSEFDLTIPNRGCSSGTSLSEVAVPEWTWSLREESSAATSETDPSLPTDDDKTTTRASFRPNPTGLEKDKRKPKIKGKGKGKVDDKPTPDVSDESDDSLSDADVSVSTSTDEIDSLNLDPANTNNTRVNKPATHIKTGPQNLEQLFAPGTGLTLINFYPHNPSHEPAFNAIHNCYDMINAELHPYQLGPTESITHTTSSGHEFSETRHESVIYHRDCSERKDNPDLYAIGLNQAYYETIKQILAKGVTSFEIESEDDATLDALYALLKAEEKQIRTDFPDLKVRFDIKLSKPNNTPYTGNLQSPAAQDALRLYGQLNQTFKDNKTYADKFNDIFPENYRKVQQYLKNKGPNPPKKKPGKQTQPGMSGLFPPVPHGIPPLPGAGGNSGFGNPPAPGGLVPPTKM